MFVLFRFSLDDRHMQNTEDYLFQVILEKTIRIPRSLSVKAATVLKAFLEKKPLERLGCSRENAFLDIVNHPFFKSIDWESVSCFCYCCMWTRTRVSPPSPPQLLPVSFLFIQLNISHSEHSKKEP